MGSSDEVKGSHRQVIASLGQFQASLEEVPDKSKASLGGV